jgi:riboflavin kinase/FMN adenylyltransferase
MKIHYGIRHLSPLSQRTVVTVGVFDGVHRGHQLIIKRVRQAARGTKGKAVVVTFDPHPLHVLDVRHRPPRLMSLAHKLKLFEELGVDICIVISFTKRFARLSPQRFIKDVLVDRLRVSRILVGDNFAFGKNRQGTSLVLERLAQHYRFSVHHVKPLKSKKDVISSSRIRALIAQGDLSRASRLLGRPVAVLGTVTRGYGRGRIIGYPTANINPHHEAIPPSGVYAVKIKLQNKLFNGIVNIGRCPTFKQATDVEPTIEVHIFNFHKNLYGKDIEIVFIKKIRSEKRFEHKDDLVRQIRNDEKRARTIL